MKFITGFVLIASVLFVLLTVVPVSGYAQLGDPGEDPDAQVPVDGGVILLIAAGVGYGVKKKMEHRKNTALFVSGKM